MALANTSGTQYQASSALLNAGHAKELRDACSQNHVATTLAPKKGSLVNSTSYVSKDSM